MDTKIYNYFWKSTLTSAPISLPTPLLPVGISEIYDQVIRVGRNQDEMAIFSYFNPVDEGQEDNIDQPTADIIFQEVIEENLGV